MKRRDFLAAGATLAACAPLPGWPTSDGVDEKVAKMRAAWRELEPLTQGFYTNYTGSDIVVAGQRENFGGNFERLVALKAKYDPMNLFRLNANVPPNA